MANDTLKVETVLELAEQKGLVVKEMKSFYKIVSPDENRKALYVGRAKRGFTRADLAGFDPPKHPAIKVLSAEGAKELKMGAVRGQILPKELRVGTKSILNALSLAMDSVLDGSKGFKLGKQKLEETPKWEPYPVIHLRTARGFNS